jgi:prepilin-type processing-associated H-X9-DG protein
MTGYSTNPGQYSFVDFPNMIHDNACNFAFADGHAETHRWLDPRTTPPINSLQFLTGSSASPRNPDIAWLQDHATRPK